MMLKNCITMAATCCINQYDWHCMLFYTVFMLWHWQFDIKFSYMTVWKFTSDQSSRIFPRLAKIYPKISLRFMLNAWLRARYKFSYYYYYFYLCWTHELWTVKFAFRKILETSLYNAVHKMFRYIELFRNGSPVWEMGRLTDGWNFSCSSVHLVMCTKNEKDHKSHFRPGTEWKL